jgi:hypothetical protein
MPDHIAGLDMPAEGFDITPEQAGRLAKRHKGTICKGGTNRIRYIEGLGHTHCVLSISQNR